MKGVAILILIVLFLWLVWPYISRWLRRKAAERTEDYLRKAMGMPPREGKSAKNKRRGSQNEYYSGSYAGRNDEQSRHYRNSRNPRESLIPKEYAEDVEYVETVDYSSDEHISKESYKSDFYSESQVSDAEWVELKNEKK